MGQYYPLAFEEGRNLTEESVHFAPTVFRDELVARIVQALARGRSVLVVGPSGVGKTAVIHEVANQLRRSGRAKLYEFSASQLLAGTKFLGEWQSKVSQIVEGANQSGSFLYFSDIWNLPTAAKSRDRDETAWDLIRPHVERNKLQLLGEVVPDQLQDLSRIKGFSSHFETIVVPPLNADQIKQIVRSEATRHRLELDDATLGRMIDLCRHFAAASEGPGPAIRLLGHALDYLEQKRANEEPGDLSPAFVEKVFSIYSGLPLFVVSPSATKPVAEVRTWFDDHVVGQPAAIEAVVEMIALFKAGLHDPDRPIGSFLFVGPTGVGKTELARALARFLFGTETRLLRFDLSEYKDYHAFQMLVGDPEHPRQVARLIDPVRSQPFQVILLDEIEKAHSNVWDLLLQLLDEGRLTPAIGNPVSFRNTIVIATSNVGARESSKSEIGFVSAGRDGSAERMRVALEAAFRPEFINRFQHVVQFLPLKREHVRQIARTELKRLLSREGIAARNIHIDVTDSVLALIVEQGYDERYGARALRRMVQRYVLMPIATRLLATEIDDGSILKLSAKLDGVEVSVVDTPISRAEKQKRQPVRGKEGTLQTRGDIEKRLAELRLEREALFARLDVDSITAQRRELEARAAETEFWNNPAVISRNIIQREKIVDRIRRLDQIRQAESDLGKWAQTALTRTECQRVAGQVKAFSLELDQARRELLMMPEDADADVIVEVASLGANNDDALELFDIYRNWATRHGFSAEIVQEPLSGTEPVVAGIRGSFAYGYLRLESGHHRFRDDRRSTVIRVRVVPWSDEPADVRLGRQRALKKDGLLGGRVRSRIEIAECDVVVQNERTLAENRRFAASVAPSLLADQRASDVVVRRYDRQPFFMRDHLTGISSGRMDSVSPANFHELLCRRVDVAYEQAKR